MRSVLMRTVILHALAVSVLAVSAAAQSADEARPRLELSSKEFDFGEVWEGAEVRRAFTLRNAGDAPLTLKSRTTCGCTVASGIKSPLAPGESVEFTVSYDTTRKGHAYTKVILTINDPEQPKAIISVRGHVKPLLKATPAEGVRFMQLCETSRVSQTVMFENQYTSPIHLKLKAGQAFAKFDLALKEIEPGQKYELTVTTKPPLDRGINWAVVGLETGLEIAPTTKMRVTATVPPRLSVQPARLLVMPGMKGPTQMTLRVVCRVDAPLNVTGLKTTLDALKYELIQPESAPAADEPRSHRINVTLPPFDDVPAEGGTLIISTDDPTGEFKLVEVPIFKYAPPPRRAPAASRPAGNGTERDKEP